MRSDIIPGGIFPDYALSDHIGIVRTLSELQGRDPLVLMLSRGHYCPKEHQQHLELAAFQSKVAVAYTQMVTISTDEHHTLQEFRASVGCADGIGDGVEGAWSTTSTDMLDGTLSTDRVIARCLFDARLGRSPRRR
jgi:hypothetical protein